MDDLCTNQTMNGRDYRILADTTHHEKGTMSDSARSWRKRVGVEPTIRSAKDRIDGFEGREDHRTLFASVFGTYHKANSVDAGELMASPM